MRIDWNRWAPVGLDGGKEIKWIGFGLGFGALVAVITFFDHYYDALEKLYWNMPASLAGMERKPIPGAVMTPFAELLRGCETVFALVCAVMPFLAAYHYLHHRRGAKSIYLMRRLPRRWELHRRCLSLPALGLVSALGLLGLLGIVFYMIYLLCTPAQCLPG